MGTARAGAHTATILHHSSCLPVFSGPAGGTGRGGARAKCQVAIVQTKQNVISTLKCDDNERPRERAQQYFHISRARRCPDPVELETDLREI